MKPKGGPIRIFDVDLVTGLWSPVGFQEHNLVLYEGSNILGLLLAGNSEYSITTMYMEYENNASPPAAISPARDDDVSYFTGLIAPKDFLRVPLINNPKLSGSDLNFSSNTCLFAAVSSGVTGVNGVDFSSAASSKVVGGALVATPTGSVSGDVIFSRFEITPVIPKSASSAVGIQWAMVFP